MTDSEYLSQMMSLFVSRITPESDFRCICVMNRLSFYSLLYIILPEIDSIGGYANLFDVLGRNTIMTILAAIDENERSRTSARIAFELAEAYEDTLVALHVMPEEDFETHRESMQSIPEFREYSFTQAADSAAEFARKFVLETVDIDSKQLEARGRVGDVAKEILSESDSLCPRFLVLSGRRQSPAGKAIFGNTAQQVLLNANCPVVTRISEQ